MCFQYHVTWLGHLRVTAPILIKKKNKWIGNKCDPVHQKHNKGRSQKLSVAILTEANQRFVPQTNIFSFLGNFVSTKYNLSGAYMPSFQKKEVGSVGQRIQLAPLAGQQASKMLDCLQCHHFRSDWPQRFAAAPGFCVHLHRYLRLLRFPPHAKCPVAVLETVTPSISSLSVFILSANLSSPDHKKDKPKSAKAKSVSNSSLSETNEGINVRVPASAYDRRGTLLCCCARFSVDVAFALGTFKALCFWRDCDSTVLKKHCSQTETYFGLAD